MMDSDEADNLFVKESKWKFFSLFERTVDDADLCAVELDPHTISKLWYDAAIFCLHRADFMRVPDIRSIQAIAVLGMCFNNWGDSELGHHMWGCASRIAQKTGLNTVQSDCAEDCLSEEGQHRLWWTLVICEC
jgi:hypothetical protein